MQRARNWQEMGKQWMGNSQAMGGTEQAMNYQLVGHKQAMGGHWAKGLPVRLEMKNLAPNMQGLTGLVQQI